MFRVLRGISVFRGITVVCFSLLLAFLHLYLWHKVAACISDLKQQSFALDF